MKTLSLLLLVIVGMSLSTVYSVDVRPTDAEAAALRLFSALKWSQRLSSNDCVVVTNALVSGSDLVAEPALAVAIAHELPDLGALLKRGLNRVPYSMLLSRAIVEGMKEGLSPIETLCGSNTLSRVLDSPSEYEDARKMASRIIAVYVARAFRKGETPKVKWEELEFESYDQQLLKYSKLPFEKVAREIIAEFSNASVARMDYFERAWILATYSENAVDEAVEAVKKDGTGWAGKVLLLEYVSLKMESLSEQEREKVMQALRGVESEHYAVAGQLRRVRSYERKK